MEVGGRGGREGGNFLLPEGPFYIKYGLIRWQGGAEFLKVSIMQSYN